jgi:hypothetical protein
LIYYIIISTTLNRVSCALKLLRLTFKVGDVLATRIGERKSIK